VSIDTLHEKIRKLKNPFIIHFDLNGEAVPPQVLAEQENFLQAYAAFCRELMKGLKGIVPGVRFSFGAFALQGSEGLDVLGQLLEDARSLGFYTLLDAPQILTPTDADRTAQAYLSEGAAFSCEAAVVSPYIGSDAIKPFLPFCKDGGKDLILAVRTPNKSASELQDLLTGGRLVHGASADLAVRYGEPIFGKCGYSRVAALVSATAADSIRNLRTRYKYLFLIADGLDYPSANLKNCSFAFDKFGYGAAICVGAAVTAAWKDGEVEDYVAAAQQSAERLRKNLQRYVTIL